MSTRKLYFVTFFSVVVFFGILLVLIIGISHDYCFLQGWIYWFSFCLPTLLITAYFLKKDPELIQRRVIPTETRPQQIIGQSLAGLLFMALIIVPALDHKYGWSSVPIVYSIMADCSVIMGFWIVFEVFKVNTYASRAIETMEKQKVIKTGVYAHIRHPMYLGAALIIVMTPIAMSSLYGLLISVPLIVVIVLRILDEEKMLVLELDGYEQYCKEVKYRLIPYIW